MKLFAAESCVSICARESVCVRVRPRKCTCSQRVLFFKRVCIFKGRCLYRFILAPELMRFRAQNKAVHFNGLAGGARRPAKHEGATVT